MIESMRKHMNWIMWITLVLIIVSFLFFGIYPADTTGQAAAKVNGDVITNTEWNRMYQNMAENWREIFKDQFNEDLSNMLRGQALQELIKGRLLSQEADRIGLRISDEELRESILRIPAFSPGGRFDQRTYTAYLDRVNLTPASFEASQREALRRERLAQIVEDGVAVSDEEVAAALLARKLSRPADMAKNRASVQQELLRKKRQEALEVYIQSLKNKADIRIDARAFQ